MVESELVLPKTWRSELRGVLLFLVFCVLAIVLSRAFPRSVVAGSLFTIGSIHFSAKLPLWWLPAFSMLVVSVARIYNVRYVIDARGVEAQVGRLSLHQRITRVRYEDIRSVEIEQTLMGRALNIGDVEISTAATGSVEIVLIGIAAPEEVQDMLQRERDSRQKIVKELG